MNMLINHDSVLSVKLIMTSIKTWSTFLGEEVVITKPDSGSCDDQNLQSEEIAATLTFTDTESD